MFPLPICFCAFIFPDRHLDPAPNLPSGPVCASCPSFLLITYSFHGYFLTHSLLLLLLLEWNLGRIHESIMRCGELLLMLMGARALTQHFLFFPLYFPVPLSRFLPKSRGPLWTRSWASLGVCLVIWIRIINSFYQSWSSFRGAFVSWKWLWSLWWRCVILERKWQGSNSYQAYFHPLLNCIDLMDCCAKAACLNSSKLDYQLILIIWKAVCWCIFCY